MASVKAFNPLAFAPGKNDFTHTPSFVLRGLKELHLEFEKA
jgi:hypothetical protein